MANAILLEMHKRDNSFYRFVLSPEEFTSIYKEKHPNMPEPTTTEHIYPIRNFERLWYKLVEIGDAEWTRFTEDGLYYSPLCAEKHNRFSPILPMLCFSLKPLIKAIK